MKVVFAIKAEEEEDETQAPVCALAPALAPALALALAQMTAQARRSGGTARSTLLHSPLMLSARVERAVVAHTSCTQR